MLGQKRNRDAVSFTSPPSLCSQVLIPKTVLPQLPGFLALIMGSGRPWREVGAYPPPPSCFGAASLAVEPQLLWMGPSRVSRSLGSRGIFPCPGPRGLTAPTAAGCGVLQQLHRLPAPAHTLGGSSTHTPGGKDPPPPLLAEALSTLLEGATPPLLRELCPHPWRKERIDAHIPGRSPHIPGRDQLSHLR